MAISPERGGRSSVLLVSRHPGVADWVAAQGIAVDRVVTHIDMAAVAPGETVIGALPVHIAAAVCARGAFYVHLALDTPPEWRGRELGAAEMVACGARLERYHVERRESVSRS